MPANPKRISIHAPREGSDFEFFQRFLVTGLISIHAPREGSDACRIWDWFGASSFLSTLPARGATILGAVLWPALRISIHAPREGSDLNASAASAQSPKDFYPRSPRGERPERWRHHLRRRHFYPRSPRGERPHCGPCGGQHPPVFLSTLPARGATGGQHHEEVQQIHFYPRSPRGERPEPKKEVSDDNGISIHAPREGSDGSNGILPTSRLYFYPRSPRGERPDVYKIIQSHKEISIHAPREGSDDAP